MTLIVAHTKYDMAQNLFTRQNSSHRIHCQYGREINLSSQNHVLGELVPLPGYVQKYAFRVFMQLYSRPLYQLKFHHHDVPRIAI